MRASLDMGVGEGAVTSGVRAGESAFVDDSAVERPETSREDVGEAWSGFAMRKPPNDCERLKSSSMLEGVVWSGAGVAFASPSSWLYLIVIPTNNVDAAVHGSSRRTSK